MTINDLAAVDDHDSTGSATLRRVGGQLIVVGKDFRSRTSLAELGIAFARGGLETVRNANTVDWSMKCRVFKGSLLIWFSRSAVGHQ